jgi:predicted lipoprotein with Yx(FWY)xxD motif
VPKRVVCSLLVTAVAVALLSVAAPRARSGASAAATLEVAYNKKLKRKIVVDAKGRTLYMFVRDTKGVPTCIPQRDRQCAAAWPGLKTFDQPTAGRGISASLVGGGARPDGTLQVAYNNHPLYYFHGGYGVRGDKKAGQIRGQGLGGLWRVLSPKGKPIRKVPA